MYLCGTTKLELMQISNLYTKPVMKAAFFVLIFASIFMAVSGFTRFAVFDVFVQLGFSALLLIVALLILTKSWFLRYNSTTEMIEIDKSTLFANVHSNVSRLGMNKIQIRDYEIKNYWLGAVVHIKYEMRNGSVFKQKIPFTLFSHRHLAVIQSDLSRVISGNSESSLFIGSTQSPA